MGDLAEFETVTAQTAAGKRVALGKLADLLERSGIDVEDVAQVNRVNAWQGFYKNKVACPACGGLIDKKKGCPECAGTGHVFKDEHVDMVGIQLTPHWAEGPQWPVVQAAKPCIVRTPKLGVVKRPTGFGVAMTLPDMQVGYFVDGTGELQPTHDEAALTVALSLVRSIRPTKIVLHGDNADFPELSRYRVSPTFVRTTQATVDRIGLFVAQIRASAGDECEIEWLEGNHEVRLPNYIIDNARAAFGLRRANQPESWPVLSIPNLCDLDSHGVTYVPGYPANECWINDRLRVIHGNQVVSNGSTAHKYLAHERVSTVYGHVHRREWAERTRRTRHGPRTILALSPGCLCRTDGAVPSTKSGKDLDGLPVAATEDWQQGIAVFTYEQGEGRFVPEQVPILDGWALYHGREFVASADSDAS